MLDSKQAADIIAFLTASLNVLGANTDTQTNSSALQAASTVCRLVAELAKAGPISVLPTRPSTCLL